MPSPSRRPRSRYGARPRRARARAWPGSAERWEAKRAWTHAGAIVAATSAAAPAMKPSSATGTRRAAPPRMTPTRPPISKPPTFASTSRPSSRSGRLTASARRTASTLRRQPSSSTPVPRPVTSSAAAPVMAAVIALAAVVLPMPMSPVATRSAPPSIASMTRRAPASIAASACARLMAGPRVMFAVPAPSGQRTSAPPISDRPPIGLATPKSATTTRAPQSRASTLTAAPPRRKFSTICAVTDGGYALTPSAVTPWSAANVKITGCATCGGAPVSAASRAASSSRRPRLPGGFVSVSRWRRASRSAPGAGAAIASQSAVMVITRGRPSRSAARRRPSARHGRRRRQCAG